MNQSKELRINRRPGDDTSDEEPSISTQAHKTVTEQKEQVLEEETTDIEEETTDIYVLNIMVKSAKNLPDLDQNYVGKDHTDAVCTVSFKDPSKDPTTGWGSFVWRTTEKRNELNPVWNESNSWPLFFDPSDVEEIKFDIVDVDTFTKSESVDKFTLKGKDIDGKPKVLKGKKNTTLTVVAKKGKLDRVPEVTKKQMEAMQREYDRKLEELAKQLNSKVGGVTAKLDGIKQVLSE